jgi:hypothetical protein
MRWHFLEFGHDSGEGSPLDAQGDYPLLTPVTSELLLHVETLHILFAGEKPLMIPIWPTNKANFISFVRMLLVRVLGVQLNTPIGL